MFSKQGFISAFKSLETGTNRDAANKYILQLQAADEGWQVASELLNEANPAYRLQGAQLFSTKASRGLPPNCNLHDTVTFLLDAMAANASLPAVSSQLCLCIAKLIVTDKQYLGSFVKSLVDRSDDALLLHIVEELPQCLTNVNKSVTLTTEEKVGLLTCALPTLIRCFESGTKHQLALACLENLWEFLRVRVLKEDVLVKCLIRLPIDDTSRLLIRYFGSFSTDSITPAGLQLIASYILSHHSDDEEYAFLFLAFVRFYVALCPHIPADRLTSLVSQTLTYVKQRKDYTLTTLEFWSELQALWESRPDCHKLLLQAFFILNSIVTSQSVLKKLIPRYVNEQHHHDQPEQDSDPYVQPELHLCSSYKMDADSNLSYREESMDLLMLCFRVVRRSQEAVKQYFKQLMPYLEKSQLTLDLVIFVLKSIVEELGESSYTYTAEILRFFFRNYQNMSNDLLVPFLQLLFDCEKILVSNSSLFNESILFFAGTFRNPILQRVSTQTLCNIIRDIDVISPEIFQSITEFINLIFNDLEKVNDEVVFDNLTGAIICYVLKLENRAEAYRSFLTKNQEKFDGMPAERRVQFMKVMISCHQANVREKDEGMQVSISKLIERAAPQMLDIYSSTTQKKERSAIVYIFKQAAKCCGKFIPNTMIEATSKMLVQASGKNFSETGALYLLLAVLNNYSSSPDLYMPFLRDYWQPVFRQIVGLALSPQLAKITIEILNKLVALTTDFSTPIAYALKAQRELSDNFETVRQILCYFVNVVVTGKVDPHRLLLAVMAKSEKYCDRYWNQVLALLIESYKRGGKQLIGSVFSQLKPQMQPSNPAYAELIQGLAEADAKKIKNSLVDLRK